MCIRDRGYIVLSARFRLTPKPKDEIKSYMAELRTKRVEKQPLEYPSAGSTFKSCLLYTSNLKVRNSTTTQKSEYGKNI